MDAEDAELQRGLGRLEGKVDQVLIQLTQHFRDDAHNFAAIEVRFAALEKKVWLAAGAASAIGPFLVYLLPAIMKLL